MYKRLLLIVPVLVFGLIIINEAKQAFASCAPTPTVTSNLINCLGTDDNDGVDALGGSDTIIVNATAEVSSSTSTFVISGGAGNDSIINDGLVEGISNG